jgi:hypothetical protein
LDWTTPDEHFLVAAKWRAFTGMEPSHDALEMVESYFDGAPMRDKCLVADGE